jgi:hypothetical protein
MREKKLRGFSAWVLGPEDPAIWGTMGRRRSGFADHRAAAAWNNDGADDAETAGSGFALRRSRSLEGTAAGEFVPRPFQNPGSLREELERRIYPAVPRHPLNRLFKEPRRNDGVHWISADHCASLPPADNRLSEFDLRPSSTTRFGGIPKNSVAPRAF